MTCSSNEPGTTESATGRRFLTGSLWMVGMRVGIRMVGLLSTVVLARLLTPADFGILAMAMLLISFVEVFSETGQHSALIRHGDPQREHYDTAWTMSMLIALVSTIVVLAISPFSVLYFDDPRIVPVIQVLSLRVLLTGFLNIGVVNFRRDLDFATEFRFGLFRKLLSFVVTMFIAVTWRSYWALVIGTVVGSVAEVVLSYLMHSYRPRFSLSKVRELWAYSTWLLIANLGRFYQARLDEFVVAGTASASQLGKYVVSAEFGSLTRTEILEPVTRALFPNYARIAADPVALRDSYLGVLATVTAIAASTGVGLALVAEDFMHVVLGPQWVGGGSLLVYFALSAAIMGVSDTVLPVLNAVGESRVTAIQTWLRVGLCIPAMAWAASTGELENFALAKLVVAVILTPTFFFRLRHHLPVTWLLLLKAVWRPLCAAALMAVFILLLPIDLTDNPFVRLFVRSVLGAVVYVTAQLGLWWLVGRPAGLEQHILQLATEWLRRRAGAQVS